MKKKGITPYHGCARFMDERTIQVGNETLVADQILIAAGAKPAPLSIGGFEHLITNRYFLELDETIVFVGGTYQHDDNGDE